MSILPPILRLSSLSLLLAGLWAGAGAADEFPLDVELRSGAVADYGSVFVEEQPDGSLFFEAVLNTQVLGRRASLNRLNFNLDGSYTGLRVVDVDPPNVRPSLMTRGGWLLADGARFDLALAFGRSVPWLLHHFRLLRRAGPSWLQEVRFVLVADQALSVDDLHPLSLSRSGQVAQVAARVSHTRMPGARRTLFVGGVRLMEPEPPPPPDDNGDCEEVIDLITGEIILICP